MGTMLKRRLQVFISSTYEDLIDQRLAAVEAILGAGHIPAAMEQFSAGDDTAWERITRWIDESDGFMLILGGRYGSIEPKSGKSYIELEYDYALESKKPLFAVVIDEKHLEERVRNIGFDVDERENQDEYKAFRKKVTDKLTMFWKKREDIKIAIFQKLAEWAKRDDLSGWIRAEDAPDPRMAGELVGLSKENRELRERLEQMGIELGSDYFSTVAKMKEVLHDHSGERHSLKFHAITGHSVMRFYLADLIKKYEGHLDIELQVVNPMSPHVNIMPKHWGSEATLNIKEITELYKNRPSTGGTLKVWKYDYLPMINGNLINEDHLILCFFGWEPQKKRLEHGKEHYFYYYRNSKTQKLFELYESWFEHAPKLPWGG